MRMTLHLLVLPKPQCQRLEINVLGRAALVLELGRNFFLLPIPAAVLTVDTSCPFTPHTIYKDRDISHKDTEVEVIHSQSCRLYLNNYLEDLQSLQNI